MPAVPRASCALPLGQVTLTYLEAAKLLVVAAATCCVFEWASLHRWEPSRDLADLKRGSKQPFSPPLTYYSPVFISGNFI